ncbi:MAG: hypothetical protein QOK39_126 [Acidimicrobiaceae bacterium]|nr:hypothetical protein [Acidimicrobiaceae bacterium]
MSGADKPADVSGATGTAAAGADLTPTQMRRREQQIGFVLAGVGAAGALSVGIAGQAQAWLAGLGVVAAIVFTLAVRRGHRIMTAVAGFLAGLAVSYIVPLQLGFLFYSGYLMMRTSNAQGKARRAQGPVTPAQRREMAAARAAARAQRRRGPAAPAPVVTKTPPPNRRYTPPKAKPIRRP